MDTYSCIEELCEKRGFEFHITGRGKWAIKSYWSLGDVEYYPWCGRVKMEGPDWQYAGHPESAEHFIEILKAVRIDYDKLVDEENASENEKHSNDRKKVMFDKIKPVIMEHMECSEDEAENVIKDYGWFDRYIPLSKLSSRLVDGWAEEIMDNYENK